LNRAEVILSARVIGGIQAIDGGEADDKIIAILENDEFWQEVDDISGLPDILVERMRHYFSTYKMRIGRETQMTIERVYDADYAMRVVEAAMADYDETYGS
ncbi:MAG TPA: inorganic pyrophosphatase, partial [Chloroflexi bacterium]|nr:inorganic pyrophosphatase [Chloroflexota bacterium]